MKNQLAHIQHIINTWKKEGSHTQRYVTADRIAAMKKNIANKYFDLSCYRKDWFACFAQGKDGQIWMIEGCVPNDGGYFDLYLLPYSVQKWTLIDCTMKNFEYRKNNTPKPPKHRNNQKRGMLNYLHKQQYGTRW